jgi:hypothetical protein
MHLKSILFLSFLIFAAFIGSAQAYSYGYSYIEHMPGDPTVYAETGTVLDYNTWLYYDAGIQGFMYKDNFLTASTERIIPVGASSASVWTEPEAAAGSNYRIHGDHYVRAYYYYYSGNTPYYVDYYGYGFYSGTYPSPYSFLQGPTGYYTTSIYKVATTTVDLTVPRPVPNLTSIDLAGGVPGYNYVTFLRGSGLFGPNSNVHVSGSGVTVSIRPGQIPNEIEVLEIEIQIAANAAIGDRNISLTVDGQTSNSVVFKVGDNSPTITSMSPDQGNQGDNIPVTIIGTHFGSNPTLLVDGSGLTATVTSAGPTQIQAVFTISDPTYTGTRNVRVKSNGITGGGFQQVPSNSAVSDPKLFDVGPPFLVLMMFDEFVAETGGLLEGHLYADIHEGQTIKLKIKRLAGSGDATFEDGTLEKVYTPSSDEAIRIKGVTKSSQANNFTIEATVNETTNVRDHFEFTVATITAIEFAEFSPDYTDPDDNPGPDGQHTTGEGLRIFPDKKATVIPDTTDRSLIKVKATVSPAVPDITVYFGNHDMDDPSAAGLPVDSTASDGNDNNGTVMVGSTPSSAGALSPFGTQPAWCWSEAGAAQCDTGSDGTVTLQFKTTMQPGDNFAISAALSKALRNNIRINPADGSVLRDVVSSNVTHISGEPNPGGHPGIRTQLLTVWRQLHIEVDSMGTVSTANKVTGKITGSVITTCPPAPQTPPCVVRSGFSVDTNLESARFINGRIVINARSYAVLDNDPSHVILSGPQGTGAKVAIGADFVLYDDDDYNMDDGGSQNGDSGEPITTLPDSFKYVSDADGIYLDGKPRNIYASAYIRPEYAWAAPKNQTNLPFELNVEDGLNNATLIGVINRDRNSGADEKDDFWVAYVLIGYQGPLAKDFDGANGNFMEDGRAGAAPSEWFLATEVPTCDCYMSSTCPVGGVACVIPAGTPKLPRGALGALIMQETTQDLKRYFAAPPVSTVTPRTIEEIKLVVPHEIGHQLGVLGDEKRNLFGIMDYSDYLNNVVNPEIFLPEHINIMRKRVKSPGN